MNAVADGIAREHPDSNAGWSVTLIPGARTGRRQHRHHAVGVVRRRRARVAHRLRERGEPAGRAIDAHVEGLRRPRRVRRQCLRARSTLARRKRAARARRRQRRRRARLVGDGRAPKDRARIRATGRSNWRGLDGARVCRRRDGHRGHGVRPRAGVACHAAERACRAAGRRPRRGRQPPQPPRGERARGRRGGAGARPARRRRIARAEFRPARRGRSGFPHVRRDCGPRGASGRALRAERLEARVLRSPRRRSWPRRPACNQREPSRCCR